MIDGPSPLPVHVSADKLNRRRGTVPPLPARWSLRTKGAAPSLTPSPSVPSSVPRTARSPLKKGPQAPTKSTTHIVTTDPSVAHIGLASTSNVNESQHAHTRRPLSTLSSSDSESNPHHTKRPMQPSSKNAARIDQESSAQPPTLLAGDISPAVMREFEDCCIGYFENKEIAEDKQVHKILAGLKDTL
jgi:hypothetical protein